MICPSYYCRIAARSDKAIRSSMVLGVLARQTFDSAATCHRWYSIRINDHMVAVYGSSYLCFKFQTNTQWRASKEKSDITSKMTENLNIWWCHYCSNLNIFCLFSIIGFWRWTSHGLKVSIIRLIIIIGLKLIVLFFFLKLRTLNGDTSDSFDTNF